MASEFCEGDESICEGCHREGTDHVTYRVEVKQQLCDDCAREAGDTIVDLDVETMLFCEKHPHESARLFCVTHQSLICESCGENSHQKGCNMKGLLEAAVERGNDLRCLVDEGNANEEEVKQHVIKLGEVVVQIKEHFELQEKNVKLAYLGEVKKSIERFRVLLRELKKPFVSLRDLANELKTEGEAIHQKRVLTLAEAGRLLDNEKDLMGPSYINVMGSLLKILDEPIRKDAADAILALAKRVSFVRQVGQNMGEVRAPVEKWVLQKRFRTARGVFSLIVGYTKCNEVVIKNNQDRSIHVLNVETGRERRVMDGIKSRDIWKCGILSDGRIVGGSCDGEVVVFNRAWRHLRTIPVAIMSAARVSVCVTRNDMILASVLGQSIIHVINPDDGEIVQTISISDKAIYDVHAMSTGDVAIHTRCAKGQDVCVVNDTGTVTSTVHLHGKGVRGIAVDRSRDAALVMYQSGPKDCVIDLMGFDGCVRARRIVEWTPVPLNPTFLLTSPDKLVIHSEGRLQVYKKMGRGLEELISDLKPQ